MKIMATNTMRMIKMKSKEEQIKEVTHKVHVWQIRLICRYMSQKEEYCKKYKVAFDWDKCYDCEVIQKHKTRAKATGSKK